MRRADVRARKLLSIGFLSLALITAPIARADDANAAGDSAAGGPQAARLTEQGLSLYKGRDYRHAAEKFLQAYTLDQDPNLLFNVARCYEALGDTEAAIEKYEAYVATPDADPQGKRRAAETVRSLRQSRGTTATRPTTTTTTMTRPMAGAGADKDAELATTSGNRPANANADEGRYRDLSGEGLALYRARDYRRAAEKFLQAYAFDPDPNLIFNVARCYAALGDPASAIEKYEAYLGMPGTDAQGREHAEAALTSLRQTKASPRPGMAAAPTVTADGGDRRDVASAPRGRVVAGWVATAVMTAATVTIGLLALDSASKLKAARDAFPGDGPDISSRASKTTALTVSTDALGLASIFMGGLSLYWTLSGPSASSSSELKASIGPGSLKISGSF